MGAGSKKLPEAFETGKSANSLKSSESSEWGLPATETDLAWIPLSLRQKDTFTNRGGRSSLLPGNLHFMLTLGPLGLQGQRSHREAWSVRLGDQGAEQVGPSRTGETGFSIATTLG